MVVAGMTFLFIIAGALVTNGGPARAVSDWPLSFGSLIPAAHLTHPYAYSHRVIAVIVGLLTLALFFWILLAERRRWVKWVAAAAMVILAAQETIGGLRVRLGTADAPIVTLAHAFLAQLFFGAVVSLTVFTSPGWVRAGELRAGFARAPKPLVFFITTAASVFLLIQVLLGTAYRQRLVGGLPHLVGVLVSGTLVFWAAVLIVRIEQDRDRAFPYLTRPARAGVWLFVIQLVIGVFAYLFWVRHTQPSEFEERTLITSVVHSGFTAALVATEVMLLIRLYRMVPIMEQPA